MSRKKQSLGTILNKVPETKDALLSWITELKNQGKLESLLIALITKKKVMPKAPPKNAPQNIKENYKITNIMIRLLKLSKIPQIEKALRDGKDWRKVISSVKNPKEIDLYTDYFRIRNIQYGGHELTLEELKNRLWELGQERSVIGRRIAETRGAERESLENQLRQITQDIDHISSAIRQRTQQRGGENDLDELNQRLGRLNHEFARYQREIDKLLPQLKNNPDDGDIRMEYPLIIFRPVRFMDDFRKSFFLNGDIVYTEFSPGFD